MGLRLNEWKNETCELKLEQFDKIKWFIRLETKSYRILPLSYATKYEMT